MTLHKNARLRPYGRERVVKRMPSGQRPEAAPRAQGGCPRTARKLADALQGGTGGWIAGSLIMTEEAAQPNASQWREAKTIAALLDPCVHEEHR